MDIYERDQFIMAFHGLGMSQKDILSSLAHFGCIISERHLRRVLKGLHLYRRRGYSDLGDVVLFLHRQLQDSGKLHGYKWMFHKCQAEGLIVRKEDVRLLWSCLDPEGCLFR